MFVITQMHGLGLSRAVRWTIGLGYIVLIGAIFALTEGLALAWQVTLIPGVEFLGVALLTALVWLGLWAVDSRSVASVN